MLACYGGLHALAWNAHFPTHGELIPWRVSSVTIASPAAVCVVLILLIYTAKYGNALAGYVFRWCYGKLATKTEVNPEQNLPRQTPVVTQMPSRRSTSLNGITTFLFPGVGSSRYIYRTSLMWYSSFSFTSSWISGLGEL